MCDDLEKENDRKTNALIDQINGENAFLMEGKLMNKKYIVENLEFDTKFKTEKEIEDLKFQTGTMQSEFGTC